MRVTLFLPALAACAYSSGSVPPRPQKVYGVPNASGRWLKSSLAVSRPRSNTQSTPKCCWNAAVTTAVTSASFSVSGYWS